jgi:hypothetical protein
MHMQFKKVAIGVAVLLAGTVTVSSLASALPDPAEFSVVADADTRGIEVNGADTQCDDNGNAISLYDYVDSGDIGTIQCTIEFKLTTTNQSVTNAPVRSSVIGRGSLASTCDEQRSLEDNIDLTVDDSGPSNRYEPSNFQASLSGNKFCVWAMDFNDVDDSKLSGNISSSYSVNTDDGDLSLSNRCENYGLFPSICFKYTIRNSAFVTGGSGTYAGASGPGEFTDNEYSQFAIETETMPGGPQGSFSSGWVAPVPPLGPASRSVASISAKRLRAGSINFNLRTNSNPSVRMVIGKTRGRSVLTTGVDAPKIKIAAAPGATCSVTATYRTLIGPRTKTIGYPVVVFDGLLTIGVTPTWARTNLGASTGSQILINTRCVLDSYPEFTAVMKVYVGRYVR